MTHKEIREELIALFGVIRDAHRRGEEAPQRARARLSELSQMDLSSVHAHTAITGDSLRHQPDVPPEPPAEIIALASDQPGSGTAQKSCREIAAGL